MKLTLLGITPEALAVTRDIISAGHQVQDVFDSTFPLQQDVPAGRLRSDWEILLHTSEFDAVVVAGPLTDGVLSPEVRARREDQLRKLVQAGMPLIVLPPVCEAIVGLELEMIRRDVRGVITTYLPRAMHPIWQELIINQNATQTPPYPLLHS